MGFWNEEKSVSPVIGTVLLIAITIVIIGIVAAFAGRIGLPPAPIHPSLRLEGDAENSSVLRLTHYGGDTISKAFTNNLLNELDVRINGKSISELKAILFLNEKTAGDNDFSTGDILMIEGLPRLKIGDTITVHYKPTKQTLLDHKMMTSGRRVKREALVLELRFNEGSGSTVYDTSGNKNDGSITGADWTAGKVGQALSFAIGSSDRVLVPASSVLDVNDYTLAFWINFNHENDGSWRQIVAKKNPDSDRSPGIWICPDKNPIAIHWRHDPGNKGPSSLGPDGEDSVFSLNKWYYLAGKKEGTSFKVFIWVDGTKKGPYTYSVDDPMTRGFGDFYIGKTAYASAGFVIDELRFYNEALADEEIQDLYEIQRSLAA